MKTFLLHITTISLFFFILFDNGCEHPGLTNIQYQFAESNSVIILNPLAVHNFPVDTAKIDTAFVSVDTLVLTISYRGGYTKHQFAVYSDSGFFESDPVQSDIWLSHQANGDIGKTVITQTLQFDMSPLKRLYQKEYYNDGIHGTIILDIHEPGSNDITTFVYYTF